jgi:hypothetical protein
MYLHVPGNTISLFIFIYLIILIVLFRNEIYNFIIGIKNYIFLSKEEKETLENFDKTLDEVGILINEQDKIISELKTKILIMEADKNWERRETK